LADQVIVSPTRRYSLAAGEFGDLQAAFDERDRLHVLTGMDAWVVTAADDSGLHRILLGVYRSQGRAHAAAKMLLDTHTLDAVTVVALPKRGDRQ
jgi:SPOR domain